MADSPSKLDEFLENVFRGASRILGCNSTNLIVINEKTRTMQVRIGVTEVDYPMLTRLEKLMGVSFRGISASLDSATNSLLYRVWQDGELRETDSLVTMVGGAIPTEVTQKFEEIIGEHRYIVAPAAGASRRYGVLVFEKRGLQPFSRQQREVLLRWARRIGDIIENDLKGHRQWNALPGDETGEDSLERHLLQLTLGEPSPAVYVDTDFRITSCNDAFEKLSGKSSQELQGEQIIELFADPAPVTRLLNRQVLYPDAPYQEESAIIRHADGSLSRASVEVLLLVDDHQRLIGFLLPVRPDRGGGNWSPGELLQQERLATMGEMAAQLAHEIRNPLVAIGATLEGLGRELDNERHQRLLSSAVSEIGRLDMVLKKYLSPRSDMVFTAVRVKELLEDVGRLLSGARKLAGKRISVDVPADLVVWADYDALKHVMFNLMLNALEASSPGGEIDCRAEARQSEIVICVDDNGPGLGAEPEDCFKPFFTVKKNGTGLGLPVCQKIARAHGGAVNLGNRPEGGCRAEVVLPTGEGRAG